MKKAFTFVLVVVALLGAAAIGYHILDRRFREWNERVENALEYAQEERARADANADTAAMERARADSLRDLPPVVVHDSVLINAPDTCAPLVAIIEDLVDERDRLRMAYDTLASSADRLRASYDTLLVVNDSLVSVLEDRPIPPPKWLPSVRVGPIAGACTDGRLCAGVGISIGWEIPIRWR